MRVALAVVALGFALIVSHARAQSAVGFAIVAAEHDPRGIVSASVVAPSELAPTAGALTVWIDGIQSQLDAPPVTAIAPLSVVAVIDASGSMLGAPLAAAKSATTRLVEALKPQDRAAVIAFADSSSVLAPLSTDRSRIDEAVSALVAEGQTALFDAVTAAALLLDAVDDGPRAMVLLSDGQDTASLTTEEVDARARSLAAVQERGLVVYVFALGDGADEEYLAALAVAGGGALWQVADEATLASLFADLGRRLGATLHMEIVAPPLAQGLHELVLRTGTGAEASESAFPFTVANEGLITASVVEPATPDAAIVINVDAISGLDRLTIEAEVRGQAVPVRAGSPALELDPWLFDAGSATVTIRALVGGELADEITLQVESPALTPQLEIGPYAPADPRSVVIARAQGTDRPVLRALADGVAVAEQVITGRQATLTVEATSDVVARIEDGAGGVLVSRSFEVVSIEESGSPTLLIVLMIGAGVAVVTVVVQASRRRPHGRAR